jgi:polar amino acid transport system permease protein
VTLGLTLAGLVLAVVISIPVGLARLSRWRLIRLAAGLYVEPIRGSSLLVQLFTWFYLLPFFGIRLGAIETGVLALGLNYGAYGSEIVRAAILSVDRGQREASTALGMAPFLALRRVIFPQAVVSMLPPFGNIVLQMLKASALVSLISITEITSTGKDLISATGRMTEVLAMVLLTYFVLSIPLTRGVKWLEVRATRSIGTGLPGKQRVAIETLPIEAVEAQPGRV